MQLTYISILAVLAVASAADVPACTQDQITELQSTWHCGVGQPPQHHNSHKRGDGHKHPHCVHHLKQGEQPKDGEVKLDTSAGNQQQNNEGNAGGNAGGEGHGHHSSSSSSTLAKRTAEPTPTPTPGAGAGSSEGSLVLKCSVKDAIFKPDSQQGQGQGNQNQRRTNIARTTTGECKFDCSVCKVCPQGGSHHGASH